MIMEVDRKIYEGEEQGGENLMNIAIWGAGKFGSYVGGKLIGKHTVICYIDNNAENMEDVLGVRVVSPAEYMENYAQKVDTVLIAVLDYNEIYEQVCRMKIERFGIVGRLVYQFQLGIADDIFSDVNIVFKSDIADKKVYMKKLETNVVDYCNLNCKGCSHFSNLFPHGAAVGYESFEKDIRHLSREVFIGHFDLLGGEAFLSERLSDYIVCLRRYMPKTTITVVSNGTLIPRQSPELLSCIRDNQVLISITEYPPTSKLRSEITGTLERFGIMYEFRKVAETFGKNIDLTGKNDPYKAQTECRESRCHFLRNGKIYKCPFSALGGHFFDQYNIPLHFEEGIDIYDEKMDLEQALKNMDTEPIALCKYCGKEERFVWEVSKNPEREEWLIQE